MPGKEMVREYLRRFRRQPDLDTDEVLGHLSIAAHKQGYRPESVQEAREEAARLKRASALLAKREQDEVEVEKRRRIEEDLGRFKD